MQSTYTSLICLFVASMLVQCGKNGVSSTPLASLNPAEKTLVQAGNSFGFRLFSQVNRNSQDKNVFLSPLSASMALGMAYNGANGETQEAMATALELQGLTIPEANASYKRVIDLLLNLDTKVQMQLANSIWYRQDLTFESEFLDLNREFFNAEISGMDFSDPSSKDVINQWVDDNTQGRIKDIIDQIDPLNVMFLINAIYFKGTWTFEFDPDDTQDESFQLLSGASKNVPMMRQSGTFSYFDTDQFQAVELPYGDGEFRMTILLPRPNVDLNTFIESITQAQWNQWTGDFTDQTVDIYLPKFSLEYERRLVDDLTALGMGIAFSPNQADFTQMHKPGNLFISNVKQKAFVEVNEEGTEAAAATVVEVSVTSVGPTNPVIRMDRPFVFAIREQQSGTVLFMGKLVDPEVD